jgi:hypothetical protein
MRRHPLSIWWSLAAAAALLTEVVRAVLVAY